MNGRWIAVLVGTLVVSLAAAVEARADASDFRGTRIAFVSTRDGNAGGASPTVRRRRD